MLIPKGVPYKAGPLLLQWRQGTSNTVPLNLNIVPLDDHKQRGRGVHRRPAEEADGTKTFVD